MKRLLTLWLTLLAAFWLTRTAVSALLFQRAGRDFETAFLLVAVPLAQTLALSWATRAPGRSLFLVLWDEVRRRRLLLGLLAGDLSVLLLALLFESEIPPAAWAGLQAAGVGAAFGLAAWRGPGSGKERLWLGLLALVLAAFGLFAVPGFEPLQRLLLPDQPPLLQRLVLEGPLLVLSTAALLACRAPFERASPPAAAALDAALGLGLAGALVEALTLVPQAPVPILWALLAWACRLLAATSLAAAVILARDAPPPEHPFDPAEGVGVG